MGSGQTLRHFIEGTQACLELGIGRGSWKPPPQTPRGSCTVVAMLVLIFNVSLVRWKFCIHMGGARAWRPQDHTKEPPPGPGHGPVGHSSPA